MKKMISRVTWEAADRNHFAYEQSDGRYIEETGDDGQDHLVAVLIVEDVQAMYDSLSDNEKFGIRFGLFPARIQAEMGKQVIFAADLMQFDAYIRSQLE